MHILHLRNAAADAEPRHKTSIIANFEESNQQVQPEYIYFFLQKLATSER